MENGSVTIGYWKIRGLGAPLRFLCEHAGIKYNTVEYEQGDGPEFSRAAWMDVKFTLGLDFPNLPYLIDGDIKLTETYAIMKYLADKYKPELLGANPQERSRIAMAAGVVTDVKMATTMPCYRGDDKEALVQIIKEKMPAIVAFQKGHKFLCGDNVTWLDFYFWEMMQCHIYFHSDFFTDFPRPPGL